MSTLTAGEVLGKLETRLGSSLPLTNRCQLAANLISNPIFIPGKEELVLSWILKTLDKKYNERFRKDTPIEADTLLWETLSKCLTKMTLVNDSVPVDWDVVAETLTNVVPHSDLGAEGVVSCVARLLALSCQSSSGGHSAIWAFAVTALLSHEHGGMKLPEEILTHIFTILENLQVDPSQDYTGFVLCLSELYTARPHPSVRSIVRRLLFPTSDPHLQLFSHLSCTEGKYQPGHVASLLISVSTHAFSAPLLLDSCPQNPAWLRHKLLSMLLSCHGFPGIVDNNSIIGATLLSTPRTGKLAVGQLLKSVLPVNLEFQIKENLNVAQYLQAVLTQQLSEEGVCADVCMSVHQIHHHHPQLLEPLIGLILEKRLENPIPDYHPIFVATADVMLKLRQLPKMISKLFLHLRSSESKNSLKWSEEDLTCLGDAISSLPKVQCLELWKALNYHLSSDVVAGGGDHVSRVARVLGPLLRTVLAAIHVADHNTPASLVPRITDLVDNTLASLQAIKEDAATNSMKTLLADVLAALFKFSEILAHYRNIECSAKVTQFANEVGEMLVDTGYPEECSESASFLALQMVVRQNKGEIISAKMFVNLKLELQMNLTILENLPDNVLFNFIKSTACQDVQNLTESPRFCAAILFTLLGKLNKTETLFIPEFEHWKCSSDLSSLDSYVGKSLSQAAISVAHMDNDHCCFLASSDWSLMKFLPLEDLPVVLKLAATILCISSLFSAKTDSEVVSELSARCLETTDLFRYLDAGMFIMRLVRLQVPASLLEVVCKSAGKFTKSILDVDKSFAEFELNEGKPWLRVGMFLLRSVEKNLTENVGNEDKISACKSLAGNLARFATKSFKKRNEEDEEEFDIYCQFAATIQNIYAKEGLGKLKKFVSKVFNLCLNEECSSWVSLFQSTANNIDHLDSSSLPETWKVDSLKKMSTKYNSEYSGLLQSLLQCSSVEEMSSMMNHLNSLEATSLPMWSDVIKCSVSSDCAIIKKDAVEVAVGKIVSDPKTSEDSHLSSLLTTIFTSSPPCVSPQLEVACLGCLVRCPRPLPALASFLSHRPQLSLSVIPVTFSTVRRSISAPGVTTDTLQGLARVLGLMCRHKADYSPVLPFLVADLVTLLQALPVEQRGLVTTALYPLLDLMEKHSFSYLSANLSPSANELFKVLLDNYNSSHRFRGKV